MPEIFFTTELATPIGLLTLEASRAALVAIRWPAEPIDVRSDPRVERISVESDAHPMLAATASQLDEYFRGARRTFDLVLGARGTTFQTDVWSQLLRIPHGRTTTYGALAEALGDRDKARAVGAAGGRNPLPIVVPCHRVIGAKGSLTGYAGGLEAKRWLLDFEGARTELPFDPA